MRQEDPETLDSKAETLVKLIRESKHFIVYTGDGVSASARAPPDFRDRDAEGPWAPGAQGGQPTTDDVVALQVVPTPTHMALVELRRQGILKYLITENRDGLHRKSGMSPENPFYNLTELYGNVYREQCERYHDYIRDVPVVDLSKRTGRDRRTGRKCAARYCLGACAKDLFDDIVDAGNPLPEDRFQVACEQAEEADLCLVLGSALTGTQARRIPEITAGKTGGKLVICEPRDTPLDGLAALRIYSGVDDLMARVMQKLDLRIPPFILYRYVYLTFDREGEDQAVVIVHGGNEDGVPIPFLHSVRLEYLSKQPALKLPFRFTYRGDLDPGARMKVRLEFIGHYGEPSTEISFERHDGGYEEQAYVLAYNPQTGKWKTDTREIEGECLLRWWRIRWPSYLLE